MNARELLLGAPDDQLDQKAKLIIEKWSVAPSAIQLLEVLDMCARYSLAADFTFSYLELLYDAQLAAEKISHKEIVKQATWRQD